MREIIRITNGCKTYSTGKTSFEALSNINFSVCEGDFVAIVGSSGSGKSTLMNIIGCLDTLDSGEYYFGNHNIANCGEKEITRIRSEKIGFIFQKFFLIPTLNAVKNVELPLLYLKYPAYSRKAKARRALENVGLNDRMLHKPNELSGGQQQRVAIARAIVTNSDIVLADEPTGNLDSKSGAAVMDILQRLHEDGKTIVLITHDEKIADIADRRIEIADGKIK